jgi:hypothetical protein
MSDPVESLHDQVLGLDDDERRTFLEDLFERWCFCELRGDVPEMRMGGLCASRVDDDGNCPNEENHL